jgi:hypothetical protein
MELIGDVQERRFWFPPVLAFRYSFMTTVVAIGSDAA